MVAPAGPVDADRLERGLAVLRRMLPGNELVMADNLGVRDGYFAGDDETRTRALSAAFADPEAGAVWCARGGYGLTRILARLDPEPLRSAPKCLIGFSDVTALLAWAHTRVGVMSIHGPVVGQLATLEERDRETAVELLRGGVPSPLEAESGQVICGGTVEGRLVVGNLEVLRSLIGTPDWPPLEDTILGLEEVGERPYRVDRALTQLISAGALRGVRGVAIGQMTGCVEPEHGGSRGWSVDEVIADRFGRLGIPVVTGFPFGHEDRRNVALPFGARVRLAADDATMIFLESVTQ